MSEARPGRRLPLLSVPSVPTEQLPGAGHLAFRCNGCGDCCRGLRVTLTHHDLRRLVHGLGRPASSFVEWLDPDEVDMTEEPGSFVELRSGRRLMVLAQRDGACHFLDASQRCSAYAFRPHDCRLYPLHVSRDEQGAIVGLERLDPNGCGDEGGEMADVAQVGADDLRRWSELADYHGRVARWNRLARHRNRFRRRVGDSAEFLAFLGY